MSLIVLEFVGIFILLNALRIISVLAVTVLSMKGVSNRYTKCATHGIIWPVFIFLLVLAWILGTLFLVTSLTGSDFCVQPGMGEVCKMFVESLKPHSII